MTIAVVEGFFSGAFAIGSPFTAMYFILITKSNKEYIANFFAYCVIQNLFSLLLHGTAGDLTPKIMLDCLIGLAAVLAGVSLGLKCIPYLSKAWLRRIACIVIGLAGINVMFFT